MTDRIYFKDIIQGKSGISDARITFVEGELQEDKVVDNGVFINVNDEVRFYPDSSYFYYVAENKEVKPVEEKAEEKGEVVKEEVEEAIVEKKGIETAELPKDAEEEFDDEEDAEKEEVAKTPADKEAEKKAEE